MAKEIKELTVTYTVKLATYNELADLIECACCAYQKEAAAMLRQFGLAESIIKQQQLEIEALKKQNADMNRRLLGWDIYEQ